MKTNKRRALAAFLLLAIGTLGFYLILNQGGNNVEKKQVRIAINIPLTGPVAQFSGQFANGIQFGVQQACKDFGIANDSFSFLIGDNTGASSTATTLAENHTSKGFDVYISGTSDESKAIFPVIDEIPKPHLLMTFDAFQVDQGKHRLRIFPHFKLMAPLFSQYAIDRDAKSVYSITLNGLATEELFAKLIEPQLGKNGIQHSREKFDAGTTDYRTIVQKALRSKPDLIFLSGFSVQLLPLIRSLKDNDYIKDGNVLCVMDFVDLLELPSAYKEFQGIAFISPEYELSQSSEKMNWLSSYKNQFGVKPNFVPAYGFDIGYLIVMAHKNDLSVTKQSILAQLPFDGITGRLSTDAQGDLQSSLQCAIVDQNGVIRASPYGVANRSNPQASNK
jgi:ABC-type branched-subunit amino acid transport system substrate-binding protein